MKIYLKDIKERFPEFEFRNYDDTAYFLGFNHDTRDLGKDELYIPIVGEKFDGHEFIREALNGLASISLCEVGKEMYIEGVNKPVILVDSIREGLQKILNYSISEIKAPIVAITGSTGKTTTKEMLVRILQDNTTVLSGEKSNTVWGNARILGRYNDEKAVVLECAMDSEGEIAWHVNSVDPDIGILLNVGYVHAEKLGDIEAIYREKKDLADYMERTNKPLILNIDDERLLRIKEKYNSNAPLVTFGRDLSADFVISDIKVTTEGTSFKFKYYDNVVDVSLKVFGEGYVYNAMAAIIAANLLHISIDNCISAVSKYEGRNGRFEILQYEGVDIVNDAYNANPSSMEMAIATFDSIYPAEEYYRIVILGDMKELGSVSEDMHKKLGENSKSKNFNEIYYIGDYFDSFGIGKLLSSADEAAAMLNDTLPKLKNRKVAVLLKGSNSLGLYQIPDFLKKLGII